MSHTIRLDHIEISITRKEVKHVQLSVHPPDGRVSMVVPNGTRLEVARAFAISKLGWIRNQQDTLRSQARETPREYIERESLYLWGKRYLLTIREVNEKPSVSLDHRTIALHIRPNSDFSKRASIIHEWHKSLLHGTVPDLITKWQTRLNVNVNRYYLRRMKTKWGSCNHHAATIRLNTELVKKPIHLLEYVVVHEMLHLREPKHSKRFSELLTLNYPDWRNARTELNELPLSETGGSSSLLMDK